MLRKLAILILILHSSAFAQNVDEGRFEMSEIGQPYWLPNEIAYGTYEDFKNELVANTNESIEISSSTSEDRLYLIIKIFYLLVDSNRYHSYLYLEFGPSDYG